MAPSAGHTPIRTCAGCRQKKPQRELVRLGLDPGRQVVFDPGRRLPGRGAYICPSGQCLTEALKKGRFSRAFRQSVRADGLKQTTAPWEKEHQ